MNRDNPSWESDEYKNVFFFFSFLSIVFWPLQTSKVNGSQFAINARHTKHAEKSERRGGETRRFLSVRRFGICVTPFYSSAHTMTEAIEISLASTIHAHKTQIVYGLNFGIRA